MAVMARAPRRAYSRLTVATSAVAALWLSTVPPSPSFAQGSDPEEQRALDLFMEAEQAYEAGEIERAVELLREARSLRQEAVLLYNLARAYETLGRVDEALEAYERYLEEEPHATDRGAIETRIRALRQQLAERERLERERREAEERPPAVIRTGAGPSPIPWVVLAVGAATIGAAVVVGVLSGLARDEAVEDPIHATASASLARAEDLALAANVLYAAGGVVALAGGIWGIVDLATARHGDEAVVALRLRPTALVLAGRW